MRTLFFAELRRFRAAALAAAGVHALLLAALALTDELFLPSPVRPVVAGIGYALGGLVLGVVQIVSWRRGDLWIYLLHRPLQPRRIFLVLVAAGAALLAVAVLLPLAVAAALAATGAGDGRHFLLAPYAWGCALAFYLFGCLVALTPWRGAFLAGSLAILVVVPAPLGPWVFVPLVVVIGWLAFLAAAATRPDLSSPPRARLATVAAALPALHVLFFVLSFLVLLAHSLGVAIGEVGVRDFSRFKWNDYFPAGSYDGTGYFSAREALVHGLRLGPPAVRELENELDAEVEVAEVEPRFRRFPRRFQPLFLDRDALLEEPTPSRRWTFSHDGMVFVGRNLRSGGLLPVVDWEGAPFDGVPYVAGRQLLTARRLGRFDDVHGEARRVETRFTLPAGERFLAPNFEATPFDVVLSDRALYLFPPGMLLRAENVAATPLAIVPLGGAADDLDRAAATPFRDGWLVSFLFGRRSERGLGEARQRVLFVARDGSHRVLVDAPLTQTFPAWLRHRGFVLSPALQTLDDLVRSTLWGPGPRTARLGEVVAHRPPPMVLVLALLVALASAVATWLLAGRRDLDARSRLTWAASALLLGLPIPLALVLFTPRPH